MTIMTQKKLYVIILSFFTIIIGAVCFSLGNYFDTNSLATEKLKTQISALEENTSSLTGIFRTKTTAYPPAVCNDGRVQSARRACRVPLFSLRGLHK